MLRRFFRRREPRTQPLTIAELEAVRAQRDRERAAASAAEEARLEAALAERRAGRSERSARSKKAGASRIHGTYQCDALINEGLR